MTSFTNVSQFFRVVYRNNMSSLQKYSLLLNVTLRMLSSLVDGIDLPEEDNVLHAVYTVGKKRQQKSRISDLTEGDGII